MPRWTISLLVLLYSAALVLAQPMGQGRVSASANFDAAQTGQQAAVAVVLDVGFGMHAQSHTPLAPNLIPLNVSVDPNSAVDFGSAIYPPAKIVFYPMLGKLSVYTGQVVVYVPIRIKPTAAIGDLKISGTISYQICNDSACFPPVNAPWGATIKTVPSGQAVQTSHQELFKDFDPRAFAAMGQTVTITQPIPQQASDVGVSIFGFHIAANSYWAIFAAALFIGIIFNMMPCVLPIVPLKAMGFYQVAQFNRAKSLLLGAVFSMGIVAAFAVLAILVVGLRWLDWGKLFSYSAFSVAIVIILLVLALQTFGVFEVVLPAGIYQVAPSHETLLGNFLFGILTAVLSTPCTFGMFAELLIWASAQPVVIGVAALMVAGVGMALPYLILAAFPAMAQRLPRAGPWAELVKQMMGFLLIATAVYFSRTFLPAGWRGANIWWAIFAVIVGSAIFLIVRTITITRKPAGIFLAVIIAVLIVAPAWAVTLRLTYAPIAWQPYSSAALADAQRNGQPVLIDFTATWCFNCQALEAHVLNSNDVVHTIRKDNILPLRADLTDVNAPGWQLLRQLNPIGAIPLTVIYLPHQPPKQLAGLYSQQDLLTLLKK